MVSLMIIQEIVRGWTSADVTLVISAIGGAAVLVVNAIFSGLAASRAGRAEAATKDLVPKIAEIHDNTNSRVSKMQDQLTEALARVEEVHAARLADTAAARDDAQAHAAELEADVIRRAEAAPAKKKDV